MELTVAERVMLFNVLPTEGNVTNLRLVRQLREALSFNEAETTALGMREVKTDGGIRLEWDSTKATTTEIPISAKAEKLIVEALEQRSRQGKLTVEYLDLYDRFVKEE